MAETSATYPEIMPVIEEYLKAAKSEGKPMRIHFWDMDHFSAEPSQVIADPGLNALAKQFGSPLYILEDVNSDQSNTVLKYYINGHTAIAADIMSRDPRNKAILDIYEYAKRDNTDRPENKTRVYYPDNRSEDVLSITSRLPANQKWVLEKYGNFAAQEMIERISKGTYTGSQQENMVDIQEFAKAKLTPVEREILDDVFNTIKERSSDPLGNKKIIEKTNNVFDQKRDVQITMYGALHYEEKSDLNEGMPGLSIGIMSTKDIKYNTERYLNKEGTATDFPQHVYYTDTRKLVKLDNDAAKAEFLGMDEKQFKAWELSKKLNEPIKLPVKDAHTVTSVVPPPAYQISAASVSTSQRTV